VLQSYCATYEETLSKFSDRARDSFEQLEAKLTRQSEQLSLGKQAVADLLLALKNQKEATLRAEVRLSVLHN
jgi:hypothetical protein